MGKRGSSRPIVPPGRRMNARPLLPAAVLLLASGIVPVQAQPSLAVMPLRALGGVSREEADTVGSLLEAALVTSAAYQVVERNEICEVLAAQEYSSEEFVDESLAVRVGQLLSAQEILLGSLSRLGDRYFLTAKIIDVATGKTLRADRGEAGSLEGIPAQAEALARRLAPAQPQLVPPPAYEAPPRRQAPEQRRNELLSEKRTLQRKLEAETTRSGRLRTAGLVCYGVSAGFVLGSGATLAVHIRMAERGAPANPLWGELSASFGLIGGLGAVVGTMLLLEREDLERIRERIRQVEQQIQLLEIPDQEEEAER
jgi:TolB-like protein